MVSMPSAGRYCASFSERCTPPPPAGGKYIVTSSTFTAGKGRAGIRPVGQTAGHGLARRRDRRVDLRVAVRRGDEAGLVLRRREVDAALEHRAVEAAKRLVSPASRRPSS